MALIWKTCFITKGAVVAKPLFILSSCASRRRSRRISPPLGGHGGVKRGVLRLRAAQAPRLIKGGKAAAPTPRFAQHMPCQIGRIGQIGLIGLIGLIGQIGRIGRIWGDRSDRGRLI